MKDSIKADRNRKVIKEEFLNDNALLEVCLEANSEVVVGLRYVVSQVEGIREQFLTKMDIYDYLSDYDNLLKKSTDNTSIAIFKKINNDEFQLDRLYDIEKHEFALDEFIDIAYQEKFPTLKLDKHLVLKNAK